MYLFLRHSERSEESHRASEEWMSRTFSVGYFAIAQYDVLFIPYRRRCRHFPRRWKRITVILNVVKNPTEQVKSRCPVLFRWDISLLLNMTHFFLVVIAREQSDRGNLPGGWRSAEYMPRTFSVGYFAIAQYDVLYLKIAILCLRRYKKLLVLSSIV